MALLAQFATNFGWGLLLVSDSESTEQIPEWNAREDVVTATETALAVAVRHGDEGPTTVRVLDREPDDAGELVFDGSLLVASEVLRISDALVERSVDVALSAGTHQIRIYVDDPAEATRVDLFVD